MEEPDSNEISQDEAKDWWSRDPLEVFDCLRNCAVTLIEIVARVHYDSKRSNGSTALSEIAQPWMENLGPCHISAKNIWWATHIRRFLTRPKPIIVFQFGERRSNYDGSCYHEVAINFADGLWGAMDAGWTAHDFVADLRFYTAAGDLVTEYLKSMTADIQCEWHVGVERFREGSIGPRVNSPITEETAVSSFPNDSPSESVPREPTIPFTEGTMVFLPDRVELCGVAVFLDPESKRRKVLNLLALRRKNGLPPYSGEELERELQLATGGAAATIRDVRKRISGALREEGKIACGDEDLICSGGPGYRLSDKLSVQEAPGVESEVDQRPSGEGGRGGGPSPCPHESNHGPNPDGPNSSEPNSGEPNPDDSGHADGTQVRRAWILQRLAEKNELRTQDLVIHFGCSLNTAKRDLQSLKREGKVEFLGSLRTGHYQLVAPAVAGK